MAQLRLGLICVQNAGRSQMATAYAEREREARKLGDHVEIISGGTHPADGVHDVVVEAMATEGIDLTGHVPRKVTETELESCDIVATMGCSTLALDASAGTEVRDWDLEDPHGRDIDAVHDTREEIAERVEALFDEIEVRLEP